jgi:hypothetical protein
MKVSTLVVALLLSGFARDAIAADRPYGPGVTDAEIKIGQTVPYSGPASAFRRIPIRSPRVAGLMAPSSPGATNSPPIAGIVPILGREISRTKTAARTDLTARRR